MKRFWRQSWSALIAVLALTLFCGMLPFAYYLPARLHGVIPSREVWFRPGGNAGPWRDSNLEWVITVPWLVLFVLPLLTLAVLFVFAPKERRLRWFLSGAGLCVLQWGLWLVQLEIVSWTVD